MGMLLLGKSGIRDEFNLSGWAWLAEIMGRHSIDPSVLSQANDGELLSADHCKQIAKLLHQEAEELETAGHPEDIISPSLRDLADYNPDLFPPMTREKETAWIRDHAMRFEVASCHDGFQQW